jgi:hypothetical protein
MRTIVLELLCVLAAVAFCLVVWWPSSLLVVAAASGLAAWNANRGDRK